MGSNQIHAVTFFQRIDKTMKEESNSLHETRSDIFSKAFLGTINVACLELLFGAFARICQLC